MTIIEFKNLFFIDSLSLMMLALIGLVTSIVYSFSTRYMKGDCLYPFFLSRLIQVCFFASLMVISDNLVLFLISWILSNAILVRLMIHKSSWQSALCSGIVSGKNFIQGAIFLSLGFSFLYCNTGTLSIKTLSSCTISPIFLLAAQCFLLLAAMTQSAIWPFHKWLISSLNSPTPVSAIMHAGLINGGGFLLVRFYFLYNNSPYVMITIFMIGILTACIGNLWKLMQHDIKRMLACSTMGQMGFMLAQCGLGLFSAAIVHLCLHGLFKAYLFLGSATAAEEKPLRLPHLVNARSFLYACLGGFIGSYSFARMSCITYSIYDTTIIILFLVWILFCQITLSLLFEKFLNKCISLFIVFIIGGMYGSTLCFLEGLLETLHLFKPQALNIIHLLGAGILFFGWICVFFVNQIHTDIKVPSIILNLYVKILNASQPALATMTNNRNTYSYRITLNNKLISRK